MKLPDIIFFLCCIVDLFCVGYFIIPVTSAVITALMLTLNLYMMLVIEFFIDFVYITYLPRRNEK